MGMKEDKLRCSNFILSIVLCFLFSIFFTTNVRAEEITLTEAYSNSNQTETVTFEENESAMDLSSNAWNPEGTLTRSIIGSDDRVNVNNSKAFPNSCTAKIVTTWKNGVVSHGTAFIVGKNKALTAGHCIYDASQGGYAKTVRAYPGRSLDSSGNIYNPYGYVDSKSVTLFNRYVQSNDANYDCGLITFNSNIGNKTGWLGMLCSPRTSFVGREFRMTGYDGTTSQMLIGKSSVSRSTSKKLYYQCDTTQGTSGAPVYRKNTDTGWTAIGIHTNGGQTENSGTRIHKELFKLVVQ